MKLELISPEKLKIVFDTNDLEHYNIDFDTLNYKNKRTREVFWEAINIAKEKTGFDPKGKKLLVEAYPKKEGGLLLYVTRLEIENESPRSEETPRHSEITQFVFRFDNSDHLDLCLDLFANSTVRIMDSSLYHYNNAYYLLLNTKETDNQDIIKMNSLIYSVCEYASRELDLTDTFLDEYAQLLIENNALDTLGKYKVG